METVAAWKVGKWHSVDKPIWNTEKDSKRKRVCIPQWGLAKSRSKSRPASSLVLNSVWSQLRRKYIQNTCFRHCGGNKICFGSSSHSPVGEKVFHNVPTTSRTCWQRWTELREQTFPICGCWEEIYWLLFRVKKTPKNNLNSISAFQPLEIVARYSSVMLRLTLVFGSWLYKHKDPEDTRSPVGAF